MKKYNNLLNELDNLESAFGNDINSIVDYYDEQIEILSSLLEEYRGKLVILGVLAAKDFEIYSIEGIKYVNFGSYPQTHISDLALINKLNKLTLTNERGYYEYDGNEYVKLSATPYAYGPNYNYVYSSGEKLIYHKVEWFKVEPIRWRILEENDGDYVLLSEMILDVSMYYHDINSNRSVGNDNTLKHPISFH